jgi:hypothetical protein
MAGWSSSAAATVEVSFVHPERYTDASIDGGYGSKASESALREIRTYLEKLGDRYLKPDQRLTIEVLDIDLAGRYEPWRTFAYDVRLLRGATWPRIKVRYSLKEGDAVLVKAEETVTDLNYLRNIAARNANGRLPYEKAMLEDWFRARFVKLQPPRA